VPFTKPLYILTKPGWATVRQSRPAAVYPYFIINNHIFIKIFVRDLPRIPGHTAKPGHPGSPRVTPGCQAPGPGGSCSSPGRSDLRDMITLIRSSAEIPQGTSCSGRPAPPSAPGQTQDDLQLLPVQHRGPEPGHQPHQNSNPVRTSSMEPSATTGSS